jgi:hypothetical protein
VPPFKIFVTRIYALVKKALVPDEGQINDKIIFIFLINYDKYLVIATAIPAFAGTSIINNLFHAQGEKWSSPVLAYPSMMNS